MFLFKCRTESAETFSERLKMQAGVQGELDSVNNDTPFPFYIKNESTVFANVSAWKYRKTQKPNGRRAERKGMKSPSSICTALVTFPFWRIDLS